MPNTVVFRRPFTKRGQNPWFYSRPLNRGSITGSGGILVGGTVSPSFIHAPQVATNIVIEGDFDNDGDFSSDVEELTSYVLSAETFTGRDWPSNLTGKAGPGVLRATLRNDDDRFSYFNTGSPINTAPFSLTTGRKIRVRTTDATNPDPVLLAKDRFRRANGALGTSEIGSLAWSGPLANDFIIFSNRAIAVTEGSAHIAVLDSGSADYYVQTEISVLGITTNKIGLVYRYVDTSNYSLLSVNAEDGSISLSNVVAGVTSGVAAQQREVYSGMTIGVLVEGAVVTAYLEGVPIFSGAAIQTSAELVGFYALWGTGDDKPEIDNFYAWDGIPSQSTGVLWTGELSDITSSVLAGPEKLAVVNGQGYLSKLATQTVTPPASITGRKTGVLVGNVLAGSMLLHPPGIINEGDVTTGIFAMDPTTAMEVARRVEETELGFLYETQEGYVSFLDRSARDGAVSVVTFTDDPAGMYGYHSIEPYDWRREVFNRIIAGVSPWVEGVEAILFTDPGPYTLTAAQTQTIQATYDGTVVRWTGHTRDVIAPGGNPGGITTSTDTEYATTFTINLPATITPGDLLLITIGLIPENDSAYWNGTVPAGWTNLASSNIYSYGGDIILAKVAVGTEDGTSIVLGLTGSGTCSWAAHIYRITDWIGSLSGVQVTNYVASSGANPNAPGISPSWGALPTLFIPFYVIPYDRSQTSGPTDYTDDLFTEQTASAITDVGIGTAQRIRSTTYEDPGGFTLSASVNQWRARTIAIQGPVGTTSVTGTTPSGSDPEFAIAYSVAVGGTTQSHGNIEATGIPLTQGDQVTVQSDDYDSQDDHNAIRTYQNAANLFANPMEAQTYADLVLATYADDRPIISISFFANKSPKYRQQAYTRRVGDKITLEANNNAGLGISQDFFIESVSHRFSKGNTLWEVTWELSPA